MTSDWWLHHQGINSRACWGEHNICDIVDSATNFPPQICLFYLQEILVSKGKSNLSVISYWQELSENVKKNDADFLYL